MKVKAIAGMLAIVGLMMFSGCAGFYRTEVMPGVGLLYSDVKSPMTTDFNKQDAPPTKTGKAMAENILGLIVVGDASVEAAAANGGIQKIQWVDYEYKNILGVYAKFTTVVHGE
jgi:hypothetical protein